MRKKLYLASSYGFSRLTAEILLTFEKIFIDNNIEVLEPFERSKKLINEDKFWAYEVAKSNYNDIKQSDGIFAIANGNPPDEGVMVEIGIAIALKKKIFIFRDDIRKCTDNDEYPLNLMIFLGLPKENWKESYFESLDEISSRKKIFIEWSKS